MDSFRGNSLGQNLYEARKRANMTLQEAADRADTSKSYVWGIERGRCSPGFRLVAKLANIYYVSLNDLARSSSFGGPGEA